MSTDDETVTPGDRVPGRRVVLTVYLAIVGVAGLLGLVLGLVNPEGMDPELFFLVDLPPTPLGMVVFGTTTVGALLGVLLLAVHYVSRYDDGRIT
jgi:uncharacterized integral membrane protein